MFRDHQDAYLNGVLVQEGLGCSRVLVLEFDLVGQVDLVRNNRLLDAMSQESSPDELVIPTASRKGRKKSNRLTNIETCLKEMRKDINELCDQSKDIMEEVEKTHTGRQRRLEEWLQEHGDP
ncbi:unnamed protein product [Prunus armeniaca]